MNQLTMNTLIGSDELIQNYSLKFDDPVSNLLVLQRENVFLISQEKDTSFIQILSFS